MACTLLSPIPDPIPIPTQNARLGLVLRGLQRIAMAKKITLEKRQMALWWGDVYLTNHLRRGFAPGSQNNFSFENSVTLVQEMHHLVQEMHHLVQEIHYYPPFKRMHPKTECYRNWGHCNLFGKARVSRGFKL